ncbi:MAG: DUF2207 domain-containing protein [Patescibacteria group bacterium]
MNLMNMPREAGSASGGRKYLILGAILLSCTFGSLVWAQNDNIDTTAQVNPEQIDSFDVTIKINSDASINVLEKIQYDFGETEHHGIYRYIPIKYKARGSNFNFRIFDIYVTDENGSALTTDISYPGSDVNIKIGDADILITGKHTYVINYTIKRAINYFNDHDELYWNVTGTEWDPPVSILESRATITLPQKLEQKDIKTECFSGIFGSTTSCSSIDLVPGNDNLFSAAIFKQSKLNPGEGLTIVIGWPVGLVQKPTLWQSILDAIKDNGILLIPVFVFIFLFWRWYKHGRDPEGRKTIIAEFEAPDNLSPAEIGAVIHEKVDNKDISAQIIYLAINGYLKIKKLEKGNDYELTKLKTTDTLVNEFDKQLLNALFDSSLTIKLSDLAEEFYKDLAKIKEAVYADVIKKGYFLQNPQKQRISYYTIAGAVLFLGFFFLGVLGAYWIFSAVLSGILVAIFGYFMPARTKKGVLAREAILGLKIYLTVAEKDRIKFFNAPAKNPEQFEKFLPVAMVLGVEKEWAGQFKDIYNQKPSWYDDPTTNNFSSLWLISSMTNFQSSSASTLASMPASASSGSSGFGGGGFSGGGGGGGGGGSW